MAIQIGHGGSCSGPSFAAEVRMWALNRTATLHDSTVMPAAVATTLYRSRTKGVQDWDATVEAYIEDAVDFDTAGTLEGSAITLNLTMPDGGKWDGVGIVESCSVRADVDQAIFATIMARCNGAALAHTA